MAVIVFMPRPLKVQKRRPVLGMAIPLIARAHEAQKSSMLPSIAQDTRTSRGFFISFALKPNLDKAADGFGAGYRIILPLNPSVQFCKRIPQETDSDQGAFASGHRAAPLIRVILN